MNSNFCEPTLVVVFATHNGGEVLRKTLDGYCKQVQPRGLWQLVIADNNSTDDTPEILQEFADRLPITTLRVAKQGKNVALNSIIDHITPFNGLILFTDDDAIPADNFLSAWETAGANNSDVSMFAGTIKPLFPLNAPDWLGKFKDHFPVLYAINERTTGRIEGRFIFGPNMAVRGSVFDTGIRFNEAIGPNSTDTQYPMGSETEFCVRAEREFGFKSLFVSTAVVLHQIRPHQVEKSFIAGRAVRHGRGFAMQQELIKSGNLPQFWKTKMKISIAKIGAMMGWHRSFWQYNWLKGYRDGLDL